MSVWKILFFPVWFPVWLVWKIISGLAHFFLSAISLFFKVLFIVFLVIVVILFIWVV